MVKSLLDQFSQWVLQSSCSEWLFGQKGIRGGGEGGGMGTSYFFLMGKGSFCVFSVVLSHLCFPFDF